MKEEENLESRLLLLADEEPAPADGAKGCGTYALVCALLASVTTITYGYSKASLLLSWQLWAPCMMATTTMMATATW
jgi:formiminotetrahydrofolate cyclodeaminase